MEMPRAQEGRLVMQAHFKPLLALYPFLSYWPKPVQWTGLKSRGGEGRPALLEAVAEVWACHATAGR